MQEDTRNVTDEFKGMRQDDIIKILDARGVSLEIAIENQLRDFNMGSIVRTANAFGVRRVHIVGRRQWNKRGAMMTDTYLHVFHHVSIEEFKEYVFKNEKTLIAVDNVEGSVSLSTAALPKNAILLFGPEGPGLSDNILKASEFIVAIEQTGSTRSINVGVAAGVVMYSWLQRHSLTMQTQNTKI